MAQTNLNKQFGAVRVVDNTTFNTGGAGSSTLKATDSGTHYNIDGTGNIVITMPALSTDNVGVNYSFLVTTAVGAGTTTKFKCAAGGDFHAAITLTGNASTCTETFDAAGDTLTLPNGAVVGTRVNLLCVVDDGSSTQTWKAEAYGSPIATVADS